MCNNGALLVHPGDYSVCCGTLNT